MTESNRVELKEKLTDDLEKEVVAFLNYTQGGVVYIGIKKSGEVVGIVDSDALQLKIKDRLKHNIVPSCLGLFEVVADQLDGKNIVKIVVASGMEKPYYIKKYGMSPRGSFVRVGSSSEPLSHTMIEDMFAKRVRNSIGKIRSHRQDLTFEQLKIYYEEKGMKLNDKFASNLELLCEDGRYNYVAYLLADTNGTSIKVAKYRGLDKQDLIENVELGYCSLIKATHRVLDKLKIENKISTQITYKERIEKPLWNEVAVREAVINAIVHNDYTTEIPPLFEIYANRIEITSSGGLSTIKSLENLFGGYSKPINRELMRVFKDLELVEHLGSGMDRILSAYPKETFRLDDEFMKNVFEFERDLVPQVATEGTKSGLSREQVTILEQLTTERGSTELLKFANRTNRTKFREQVLNPLLDQGLIELTIPDKPTSSKQKYRLTAIGKDFTKGTR